MCAHVCHCVHVKVKNSTHRSVFSFYYVFSGDQTQVFSKCLGLLSHLLVLMRHLGPCCLWLRMLVYPVQMFRVRWAWPSPAATAAAAATAAESSAWLSPCAPGPGHLLHLHQACCGLWPGLEDSLRIRVVPGLSTCCCSEVIISARAVQTNKLCRCSLLPQCLHLPALVLLPTSV